jgi:two-component system, cell cycle sensor histidine kinase and response regulator CckA
MNSPREKLLSTIYATRPLTQRASRRSAIGIREVITYFLIFSFSAGAIGIFLRWYIASHYKKEMASWQTRQTSLADDQAQRVEDWLKERQGDAQVLSAAPAVRAVLRAHALGRSAAPLSSTPRESPANLDNLAKSYSYAGVFVLDQDGQVVLQSTQSVPLNPVFSEYCRAAASSRKALEVLVGDLPVDTQMGFISPVFPESASSVRGRPLTDPLGIVLLVSDASKSLFPLVTRDVIPTRTGETLLVRRDGNDVVFFSPERLAPTLSRQLRFPLPSAPVPARLALEGRATFGAYMDYRGVQVLAATESIPGIGWGLVRKIDRNEALEDFHRAAIAEILAGAFLIILLGSLIYFHRRDLMMRAVKQDEKKFKALLESPPDVMIILNRTGHIVFVNSATERMFGYRLEELLGKPFQMLVPQRFEVATVEYYERFFTSPELQEQMQRREAICRRNDGSEFPAEINSTPIETLQGAVVGVAVRDISQRKQAEEALRQSEERYRTLFENAPVGIYRTTPDGRILAANPALVRILGYASFEDLAKPNLNTSFFAPEYPRSHFISLMEEKGTVAGLECVWHKKDGEALLIRENARAIRDASGKILYYEGTAEDITEHKRAEEENTRLVTAIEQSAEGVVVTNTRGEIEYVNPAFTRMTGYSREEALGQNPRVLKSGKHDPEFYRQLWAMILDGQSWHGELVNRRKDGTFYTEQMSIAPVRGSQGEVTHFIATKQDVTERKVMEAQLQQAAKIEAVGRLAGGVAHDFNNLLTIINGYSELLLDELGSDETLSGYLKEIHNAGDHAAALTSQLLAFSRRQVLAPHVLDLNSVVSTLESMLRRLIGEDIELLTNLSPTLGLIKADPGQIDQVIMNLAVNARDAMPFGGKLTIETSNVEIDESYAHKHPTVKPFPHVMLAVTDTGAGMTPEIQEHIFEPFFTTKEKGKGTGLGLATVYGIVKQSGGSIWVYSELGKGTVFKVYFPLVSETTETGDKPASDLDPSLGTETILLVEDEEGVRSLVRLALSAVGYHVLETTDPESALATCASHDGPIHLLLTDVVMPQMSGPIVATKVTALRPGIRVLYMSGYTDDAVVHHGVLSQEMPFIQKPFSPLALRKKIREVLGRN